MAVMLTLQSLQLVLKKYERVSCARYILMGYVTLAAVWELLHCFPVDIAACYSIVNYFKDYEYVLFLSSYINWENAWTFSVCE